MKRIIAFLTVVAIIFLNIPNVFSAEQGNTTSQTEGSFICETADECVENITVGLEFGVLFERLFQRDY